MINIIDILQNDDNFILDDEETCGVDFNKIKGFFKDVWESKACVLRQVTNNCFTIRNKIFIKMFYLVFSLFFLYQLTILYYNPTNYLVRLAGWMLMTTWTWNNWKRICPVCQLPWPLVLLILKSSAWTGIDYCQMVSQFRTTK